MVLCPEKIESIVIACCSLHNFLRSRDGAHSVYTPQGSLDMEDPDAHQIVPGEWCQGHEPCGLYPFPRQHGNRHSNSAKELRDYLRDFFNSEDGAVSWQDSMI